ncbi:MAG: class I SAM-dependent methyltransferase [Nitrospirae bacterium]|nr:MAG: class I SAM-dependent methyltransferase [Nitrospirota bacterium]
MNFTKYKERGAYHYQWYQDNTFGYRDLVDTVVDFCEGSILDLGCGEGLIGSKLLEKGIEDYLGYDSDPIAVQLADPELDIRQADIEEPAAWHLDYEYLVCLNTIEHLQNAEVVPFIFEHCISKAGIIITDKPGKTLGKFHIKEFTKEDLLDLFKDYKPKYFEPHSDFHGVRIYK